MGFTWATGFSGVGVVSPMSPGIGADLVSCNCCFARLWSTGKCTLADDTFDPGEPPVFSFSRLSS